MAKKVPSYTFTGQSYTWMNGGTWYILLLNSGNFKMDYSKKSVDIFLCGGGGGGASTTTYHGGGGGAGGYLNTQYGRSIGSGSYFVTVGNGGYAGERGEATSAFGFTAQGGAGGSVCSGATDGTGAGGDGGWYNDAGNQGANGLPGAKGQPAFGAGDVYYGAGGGGGATKYSFTNGSGGQTGGGNGGGADAQTNTGAGGGGAKGQDDGSATGGRGGSGIVILRGTEDDFLPVFFNGKQMSEIFFNGTAVTGLIYDGTRIFARRCREWLLKRWACRYGFRREILAL